MGKKLVFVGGGHAHLTALVQINEFVKRGHSVTLISADPYHYYSGMGPGMLAGMYRPEEVRFHIKKLAEDRGASFVADRVTRIDPARRTLFLESGNEAGYDVVSFNSGSDIGTESYNIQGKNIFTVKPIVNLFRARRAVLDQIKNKTPSFTVIGGGAAGVEIAANLWRLIHNNSGSGTITLIAGKKLLRRAPERARKIAAASLAGRGIEIVEGAHVKRIEEGRVTLTNGRDIPCDTGFLCTGVRPSPIFRDSGLPVGGDGGLLVNRHLQSVAYPDIFGGGDCISLEGHHLQKVGVYAVRENPVLCRNLFVALEGGNMAAFHPGDAFLLILNLGNGKGLFWRKGIVWDGRPAFLLKDFIDRRFMRKFQLSGELSESSPL
jgi:NADH dehydrogenase FAD-containing subunit